MSLLRQVKAWLFDSEGNPLSSYFDAVTGDYVLNVHDADVHKRTVNRKFHRHTTPETTLAVAASAQDTSITVVSDAGFIVGGYLHIENGVQELVHPRITSLPGGNIIVLNKPLDNGFEIGTNVQKAIINMNENGSLAAPFSYKVEPLLGEVWHMTKISIAMAHSSAGDLGKFGNIAGGLPNGLIFRRYDGLSDTYSSFTIWQNNGDINSDAGNVDFPLRSGGGGAYGTTATGRLQQDTESIAYLNGTNGDYLEILNQDNLSSLGFLIMKAQGHFE